MGRKTKKKRKGKGIKKDEKIDEETEDEEDDEEEDEEEQEDDKVKDVDEEEEDEEEESEDEEEEDEEEEDDEEDDEDDDEEDDEDDGEMRKYLENLGFKGDVNKDAGELLSEDFDLDGLKKKVKKLKKRENLFSDRGAVRRILRDMEDKKNRCVKEGFVLGLREIERGHIMDFVDGDSNFCSMLIGKDFDSEADGIDLDVIKGDEKRVDVEHLSVELSEISKSRGDDNFFIYRSDSTCKFGDDVLDMESYLVNISDINEEKVYLISGAIGRSHGAYPSGVEAVPMKAKNDEIVQLDILDKKGSLNLRLYVTDGENDTSVKVKNIDALIKLVKPDSENEFIDMLRNNENREILRVLRDELTGIEVEIFGRGSRYAPDGTELANAWLDIGKWGHVTQVS